MMIFIVIIFVVVVIGVFVFIFGLVLGYVSICFKVEGDLFVE